MILFNITNKGIILAKIILIFIFIFSTINAKDFYNDDSVDYVQTFVSLDYNIYGIDKEGIDNQAIGLSGGWIVQDVSSVTVSYFIDKVDNNSTNSYDINRFDIDYSYSFNNLGKHRGVILSSGISRNSIDEINLLKDDTTDVVTKKVTSTKSIICTIGIGYEYQVNSSYIFEVRKDFNIINIGGNDNSKDIYNAKFSIKYIFE